VSESMSDPTTPNRRSFTIACLIGGVIAVIGYVLVLHVGSGGFFRQETFGNFFDTQANAWLHGRWNVPPGVFFIEGFRHGAKTYTYFGPWPALLRLPLLAITGSPSGHLTPLSMTIAFAVAMVGVAMTQWRLREMFRPGRPLGRGELALSGAVVFATGCGTTLLFLASRAWVYHEALMWGVALSIVAYERTIAFMMRPTRGRLVAAAIFAGLAFLSRASVGTGPMIALGLVLVGRLLRAVHDRWSARRARASDADSEAEVPDATPARRGVMRYLDWLGGADDRRTWIIPIFIALAIPSIIFVYVNYAKFGTLFSIPWRHQELTLINPRHRRILDQNGGTYFGLKFAPSTLFQYFRPDALSFDPHFPWVMFPRFTPHIFGGVEFDTLDPSTSLVTSMPAFTLLGIVGLIAAVFPRFGRTREAAWLRVPLIGAIGGVGPTIAISFIAERYLGDFVPLIVLAALIGIQVLMRRNEGRERRGAARVWIVVVSVLALFGVWVNGGLAVVYARLYVPQHDTDRLALLQLQRDLDVGGPYSVGHSDALPVRPSRVGTTWIVGDCDSMYWTDGTFWFPVSGTAAGGWFRLAARPADLSTRWQPLVTDGTAGNATVVAIRRNPDGRGGGTVDVGLGSIGADGKTLWPTRPHTLPFGPGRHRINVLLDHAIPYVRVTVDGTNAALARGNQAPPLSGGPFTVSPRVRQLPDSDSLCRDLLGSATKS
jgi:hypothetical protein